VIHAHKFCPGCGLDLVQDQPVIIDKWSMFGHGYPLCYEGRPLRLTHHETDLCWTLMKAFPRHVRHDILLDRMDSDGTPNTLNVFVHRVRAKLRDVGIESPIRSVRGIGYVWVKEGDHEVAEDVAPSL
jgi:DNA-binding response OmpR family regulator